MNQEELDKRMGDFGTMCADITLRRLRAIDRALITAIEIVEGRVPSEEEVSRHGQKTVWPNVPGKEGVHYYWKDFYLFTVQDYGAPGPMITRKSVLLESKPPDS